MVSSNPDILINSPLIEEEAFYRLRNYPEQIEASMHHAIITIPRKLAYILHNHPAYIAPATEAFYLRDAIALKSLRTSSSDLVFAPQDLVTVSTRFTKVLYAQLKSQQFEHPLAWRDIITQAVKESGESGKRHSKLEMGMKVTSGFEMLVTDSKSKDNRVVRELKLLLDDLAENASDLPSDQVIAQWEDITREDSESWLDINFEDFEKELQGKSRERSKSRVPGAFGPEPPSGFGDFKTQADLKKMVERFESFLNEDKAGIDGAELDEMDFDDGEDEDEDDNEEDSEDEDKDVSFDEEEFSKMMREMMGMPPEEDKTPNGGIRGDDKLDGSDDEEDLDEARKIVRVMEKMEAELNEAGALNLGPPPRNFSSLDVKQKQTSEVIEEDDESGDDAVIDYDLAKTLLESFESQHGMGGLGENLLAALGLQVTRDEEDTSSRGTQD